MAFCVYGLVIHSNSINDLKFLLKTAVVVDNGKVFTILITSVTVDYVDLAIFNRIELVNST